MSRAPAHEAALGEIVAALRESGGALSGSSTAEPSPGDSRSPAPPVCALCRLAERSVERSLRSFFSEFVNDPQIRLEFRRARGFCRAHTPLLAHCGDALGVAILYADLADETRERWRSGAAARRTTGRGRWFTGRAEAVCPACATEADADARYAGALAGGLAADPELWDLLHGACDLCARHVEKTAAASTAAVATRLLAMECARMDALFAELEEFVRKSDYRFTSEGWGPERDAWRRALQRLRG